MARAGAASYGFVGSLDGSATMMPMRSAACFAFSLLAVLGTGCNRDVPTTVEGFASFELSDDTVVGFEFDQAIVLPDEDTADASTPVAGHCILEGSNAFLHIERATPPSGPAGLESFDVHVDGDAPASIEAIINGQTFEGDCEIDVTSRDPGAGVYAFNGECTMLGAAPDTALLTVDLDFDGCK